MKKIYIVEDEEAIRILLETYLKLSPKYEIILASEPKECPLYTQEKCHCEGQVHGGDILIVDHFMPGLTGLEFVQKIMQKWGKDQVRNVAIMSAALKGKDRAKARELGCMVFEKPLMMSKILEWIESRN